MTELARLGAGVTVVVPAWGEDYGPLIDRAVDSVRRVLPDAEIVLVDNGSHPPLPRVNGAAHVRLDETDNLSAARSAGLRLVETPWVIFLDADDELSEGIRQAVEIADRGGFVLVSGALRRRQDPRIPSPRRWPPRYAAVLVKLPRLFSVWNAVRPLLPVIGAAVICTNTVRHVGLQHLPVDEDWLLSVRLSRAGAIALRLDLERPALIYRTAPGTLSRRPVDVEEQRLAHKVILDEALAGLPGRRPLTVPLRVVQGRVRAGRARAWGHRADSGSRQDNKPKRPRRR